MEIFNIGFPELILILVIMLIVLGPDQTIQQMRNIARFVRKLVRSPLWADIVNTSREIKDLPTKMIQETGLEDENIGFRQEIRPQVHPPEPGLIPPAKKTDEIPLQAKPTARKKKSPSDL